MVSAEHETKRVSSDGTLVLVREGFFFVYRCSSLVPPPGTILIAKQVQILRRFAAARVVTQTAR